jgi:hypothetical protein
VTTNIQLDFLFLKFVNILHGQLFFLELRSLGGNGSTLLLDFAGLGHLQHFKLFNLSLVGRRIIPKALNHGLIALLKHFF